MLIVSKMKQIFSEVFNRVIAGVLAALFVIAGLLAALFVGFIFAIVYEIGLRIFIASIAGGIVMFVTKWLILGALWIDEQVSKKYLINESAYRIEIWAEDVGLNVGIAVGALVFAFLLLKWFFEWKIAYDFLISH